MNTLITCREATPLIIKAHHLTRNLKQQQKVFLHSETYHCIPFYHSSDWEVRKDLEVHMHIRKYSQQTNCPRHLGGVTGQDTHIICISLWPQNVPAALGGSRALSPGRITHATHFPHCLCLGSGALEWGHGSTEGRKCKRIARNISFQRQTAGINSSRPWCERRPPGTCPRPCPGIVK